MKLIKTKLNESSKKIIVHFYFEGEAGDSEQVNLVILDPELDFDPSQKNMRPTITQIWSGLSWFDALLKFEDAAPEGAYAWVVTRDTAKYDDFRYFGGLKDRAGLDGGNGRVLMSTSGFQAGSVGTMVIEFKKD